MPGGYRSNGSIADLMLQRGRSAADTARQNGAAAAQAHAVSGQAWGNAIQNIGQAAGGTLRDIAQQKADAPNRELRQRQSDMLAKELSAMDTAAAQAEIGRLAGMVKASGYDPGTAEPLFRAMGRITPDYEEPLLRSLMDPEMLKNVTDTLISQVPGAKAPEGFTLGEGQQRFGPNGEPLASVPKTPPPPPVAQPFTLGEGQTRYNPDGTIAASGPAKPVPVPQGFTLSPGQARYNPDGTVAASVPPAPHAPAQPTQRFSRAEVTVDGESITANYDALTGKYHDVDTGAVLSGVKAAPTADMRNKTEGRQLVKSSIEAIEKLSKDVITKIGPAQRADAIKRGVDAVFGNDPTFRTYQDARMALAGNLAVAQQGSRPSDADIRAIWLPLVPDAYRDTDESATMKWELIKKMSNVSSGATPGGRGSNPFTRPPGGK
jgi:hypothetical protein